MKLRLTYSGVVSTLALFIAVSTGGAYAKATLIDGKAIKNNSIPATKIQNGTITAADLKRGSLPASVLSPAAVEQLRTTAPASTPASERVVGQPCRFLTLGTQGIWEVATALTSPMSAGKTICIVRDASGNFVTGSDEAVTV